MLQFYLVILCTEKSAHKTNAEMYWKFFLRYQVIALMPGRSRERHCIMWFICGVVHDYMIELLGLTRNRSNAPYELGQPLWNAAPMMSPRLTKIISGTSYFVSVRPFRWNGDVYWLCLLLLPPVVCPPPYELIKGYMFSILCEQWFCFWQTVLFVTLELVFG